MTNINLKKTLLEPQTSLPVNIPNSKIPTTFLIVLVPYHDFEKTLVFQTPVAGLFYYALGSIFLAPAVWPVAVCASVFLAYFFPHPRQGLLRVCTTVLAFFLPFL